MSPSSEPSILLVEDNPDDVELLRIAMLDAGMTSPLDVVRDGVEALQFLHAEPPFEGRQRPSLVLLDLNLPTLDGREVLRSVKADPDLCSIPVVVMTTSVDDNDIDASYHAHANSFVSKPANFDELVTTLRAINDFWFSVVRLPRH